MISSPVDIISELTHSFAIDKAIRTSDSDDDWLFNTLERDFGLNSVLTDQTQLCPRSISVDLYTLSTTAPKSTLQLRPTSNPRDIFSPVSSSWKVIDVAMDTDDLATTVMQNQERLREYSSRRFGGDSEGLVRGQGPQSISSSNPIMLEITPVSPYLTDDMITKSLDMLSDILDNKPISSTAYHEFNYAQHSGSDWYKVSLSYPNLAYY